MQGKLLIFSAPSGSGKTTIVRHLLKVYSNLAFSVSACSRPLRPGEVNGRDYYFLTADEFKNRIENNEFIEWEEVYPEQFYGTLRSELNRIWKQGKHVVFDVDVLGGINIKKQYPSDSLSVFIQAPSIEELEKRLRARSTESEESLQKRMGKAREEMTYASKFDVILINQNLGKAFNDAENILKTFLND